MTKRKNMRNRKKTLIFLMKFTGVFILTFLILYLYERNCVYKECYVEAGITVSPQDFLKKRQDGITFGLYSDAIDITEAINFLKSLRPQKQWKPSEEQIKAVKEAACYSSVFSEKTIDNLISLSKQLKAL